MNELKRNRLDQWFLFSLIAVVTLATASANTAIAGIPPEWKSKNDVCNCSLQKQILKPGQDGNGTCDPGITSQIFGPAGDWQILLVWGELQVILERPGNQIEDKGPGYYTSTYSTVPDVAIYYNGQADDVNTFTFTLDQNNYTLKWNASGGIKSFYDKLRKVDLLSNTSYSGGNLVGYFRGAREFGLDYDDSNRITCTTEWKYITTTTKVIVKKTHVKYTEEEATGYLLRKRVTVETYNSDHTEEVPSKRFLTTIYVYYGDVTGDDNDFKPRFIVEPEGVKRYLVDSHLANGIDPSDRDPEDPDDIDGPAKECGLDTVSEGALDDYASVIYHLYDSSGRVLRVEGGSGCGCAGEGVKHRYWYGNIAYVAGDANSCKTYRRTAVADDSWAATADDPRTVEFINQYGNVVYEVKQEMSDANTIAHSWVTHHKYETKSFTAATSDTCTSNGHGLYTGQSIWVSTSNNDLPLGLTAGKMYWARSTGDNIFTLHTSKEGAEAVGDDVDRVDIEDAGTVPHSLQYNRISEVRSPSACASTGNPYGTTTVGGWVTAVTPNSAGGTGLVRVYKYYMSDDAGNGKYKGQLECEKVRKGTGSGNDEHLVGKYTYKLTDYNGSKVYHIATETVYQGYVTSDTGGYTTTYVYTFYQDSGDTHAIREKTVTYPIVEDTENGSDAATTVKYHYKQDTDNDLHYNDWTKHEDGSYSYTELNDNGELVKTIQDVDDTTASTLDAPTGFGGRDGGLDLTTTYAYDNYGRTLTVTDPASNVTKYAYMCQYKTHGSGEGLKETTTHLVTLSTSFIDSGGHYDYVPMSISVANLAGEMITSAAGVADDDEDGDLTNDWDATKTTIGDTFEGTLTARTEHIYEDDPAESDYGRLTEVRRYHALPVPASGDGTSGTNYYRTSYAYDDQGRQWKATSPNGTISISQFDKLGRSMASWIGTDATDATVDDPEGDDHEDNNMVNISETFYDGATTSTLVVGDGNVTQTRAYYGSENYYETLYLYDYRSRLERTLAPGKLLTVNDLDNMGRTKTTEIYAGITSLTESPASTKRRYKTETKYDPKGQAYQTLVYKITGGTPSVPMTTNYWYDAAGRTIKVKDAAGMFSKTQYDGAGRAVASFACYDDVDTEGGAYAAAGNVSGDIVIRATWTEYDDNRAVGQWVGTELGATPTQSDPNAGDDGNMVRVARTWYDTTWNDSGSARPYATGVSTLKANLTTSPDEDDVTTNHDPFYVRIKYDYNSAGRRYKVTLPAASGGGNGNYTTTTFDDLGRSLITQTYKQGATPLLTKAENTYCASGVESTKIYKVSNGTASDDHIKTTYDYDGFGRLRKTTQPSGSFTKTVYNDYGRVTGSYLCTAEGATGDITDDTVVEQTIPSYDDVGRVWLTTSAQRNHDGSGAGALTASNARVTYSVTWFDDLGRTDSVVAYGTNGTEGAIDHKDNSDFNSGETGDPDYDDGAPAPDTSDDQYVVTKYDYDGYGRNHQVTDNAGHVTKTFFDSSGRKTHIVENYEDFVTNNETASAGGGDNNEQDRVTKFTYVGPTSLLKEQIAIDPVAAANNQVTRYVYAVELAPATYGSWQPVKNGAGLLAVIYPDSNDDAFTGTPESPGSLDTTAPDHVELAYYANGSKKTRKDQRGCIHTYVYDDLGRPTKDRVTTLGGADNFIQSIVYAYDDLGRRQSVKSWSGNNGDGTCRNEVLYFYNGLGMLTREYQEHEGVKHPESLRVAYNYDDTVSSNVYTKGMRLKSFQYPHSVDQMIRSEGNVIARLVHQLYTDSGGTSGIGDKLSRVTAIAKDTTRGQDDENVLSAYSYNGAGTIVIEDYQQPEVKLDYVDDHVAPARGAGEYEGLDRFGRVKTQTWRDYGANQNRDKFNYTYDANSNRTSRDVDPTSPPTGKDEKYTYDGLDRLKSYDRGTLSGGDIINKVRNEAWTLSQTGNWGEFKIDADGDGSYDDAGDLDQNRAHNDVNEITGITEDFGPVWAHPAHDLAGNMTTVPKPTDMENAYACKYDAWNRLVEVKSGANVVGKYEYDGLNRRIKKHIDTQAPANPNGVDTYRHFYYNSSWQIVETRSTTSSENTEPDTLQPEYQYVWSLRYIDAPILRDENDDADDLCDDERLYYLNDANMNVTCLTDENGDAVERYVYDPYGKVTIYDGTWTNTRSSSSYDNCILFCGYYRDPESGLYHVRYRYYHPTLGRWVNRDPIGYASGDGMNLYEYVSSKPIGWSDSLGNKKECCGKKTYDTDTHVCCFKNYVLKKKCKIGIYRKGYVLGHSIVMAESGTVNKIGSNTAFVTDYAPVSGWRACFMGKVSSVYAAKAVYSAAYTRTIRETTVSCCATLLAGSIWLKMNGLEGPYLLGVLDCTEYADAVYILSTRLNFSIKTNFNVAIQTAMGDFLHILD